MRTNGLAKPFLSRRLHAGRLRRRARARAESSSLKHEAPTRLFHQTLDASPKKICFAAVTARVASESPSLLTIRGGGDKTVGFEGCEMLWATEAVILIGGGARRTAVTSAGWLEGPHSSLSTSCCTIRSCGIGTTDTFGKYRWSRSREPRPICWPSVPIIYRFTVSTLLSRLYTALLQFESFTRGGLRSLFRPKLLGGASCCSSVHTGSHRQRIRLSIIYHDVYWRRTCGAARPKPWPAAPELSNRR